MDNTNRFTGKAKEYTKSRPGYPKEFLDYLFTDIGFCSDSVIADIGSGTGKLTKELLRLGCIVYAVEPNFDMRETAERELGGFDKFNSLPGSAEKTGIADNSVDFVTVAQAFHWFDHKAFGAECRRILKTDGSVVLVWNMRDEKSGIVKANDIVCRKYCPKFTGFSGGINFDDEKISAFFGGEYNIKVFENNLSFDRDGFISRNLSSSYALSEGDKDYDEYISALNKIFDEYSDGEILIMPNITTVYVGRL